MYLKFSEARITGSQNLWQLKKVLINFRERKFLKVTHLIGHILVLRKFETDLGQNLSGFAKCNCTV